MIVFFGSGKALVISIGLLIFTSDSLSISKRADESISGRDLFRFRKSKNSFLRLLLMISAGISRVSADRSNFALFYFFSSGYYYSRLSYFSTSGFD